LHPAKQIMLSRPNQLPPTILMVEDDLEQAQILRQALSHAGFSPYHAASLDQARKALTTIAPDLVLLDLTLGDGSGRRLLEELRLSNNLIPVIMLSAVSDAAAHARALEEGADDFIVKPFHPQELFARISAVLRRYRPNAARSVNEPPAEPRPNGFCFGPFALDLQRKILIQTLPTGAIEKKISSQLFSLLRLFLSHPNQTLSREKISVLTQGRDFDPDARAIDVHIGRLRKLIEPDHRAPIYLRTEWGQGYRFTPQGGAASLPPEQQSLRLDP
jgi:DNA-binding response OmpR family regulator